MEDRFKFRVWDTEAGQFFCQCTGLKDKNGKLIFEGDILGDGGYRRVFVEWDEVLSGFLPWVDDEEYIAPPALEIIGNIYENPELLK